jgi:hypothetical protein
MQGRILGFGQVYLETSKDKSGNDLDGGKTYRICRVVFLSWNRHPEPTGSRRETPLLLASFSTFPRASSLGYPYDVGHKSRGEISWYALRSRAGRH